MGRDVVDVQATDVRINVGSLAGPAPPDEERARIWQQARHGLAGLPGGGLNIAYEALDRHVAAGRGMRLAQRFLGPQGLDREVTFADLADASARFDALLDGLGVGRGERVFGLSGRLPELYTAILGTLRHGAVFCPLFAAFGPEPVRQRLRLGTGVVLVTTASLYRRRVAGIRDDLPHLRHVLLVGPGADAVEGPGVQPLAPLLAAAAADRPVTATGPEDPALLHFTSGTTGMPKGVVHVHDAVVAHHATAGWVLDLQPGDVFWCTADPGWVTGMSYGVIAPLSRGVTSIVDELEFDVDRWYALLDSERVTVWYTSPTALRMLMRAGAERAHAHDLSALRLVASVGEPLNPEVAEWGQQAFGRMIHDTWWQTETGAIMIATRAADDVRPGSMGRAVPGVAATLLARDDQGELLVDAAGHPVQVGDPDAEGEIALRVPWPSMLRDYLGAPDRYAAAFTDGWYRSGDLARRDADGWFWFVGRGDDVIKTSGHLIGPFEVENVLMEHPAVAEAAAVGIPDPVAGEVVKAFVVLNTAVEPSEALRRELIGFGRSKLGAAVAPRDIAFRDGLPHTRSGKTMRRLLRARELGLPEGDLSTLEVTG